MRNQQTMRVMSARICCLVMLNLPDGVRNLLSCEHVLFLDGTRDGIVNLNFWGLAVLAKRFAGCESADLVVKLTDIQCHNTTLPGKRLSPHDSAVFVEEKQRWQGK